MSMKRPRHNMGRVDWIGAEALGLPGQRTFRLLVLSESMSAQLWLEKQQLQALALLRRAVVHGGRRDARRAPTSRRRLTLSSRCSPYSYATTLSET